MPDFVPPGNTPLLTETDPASQIAAIGRETYDALWPRTIIEYTNAAARDADLAGLGPSDVAFAYLKDRGWVTRWTGTEWRPAHPVGGYQAATFTSGLATITHNLGFVPSLFMPFARLDTTLVNLAWALGAGTTTTTTVQVRAWTAAGAAYTGSLSIVSWIAMP